MFRSIIKWLWALPLLIPVWGVAQSRPDAVRDTLRKSETYGLRLGLDLSRPLISAFREGYTGLELVGDLRISNRLYLAT